MINEVINDFLKRVVNFFLLKCDIFNERENWEENFYDKTF